MCLLTNYPYQLAIIELAVYSRPRPVLGHLSTADTPNDHIKLKYLKRCFNIYDLICLDDFKSRRKFHEKELYFPNFVCWLYGKVVGHIPHYQRHILPCENKTNYFSELRNFVVIFCIREH